MNSSIARAISSPNTARIAAFGVSPPSDFSGAELMLSNDWATYSSAYSSVFPFFWEIAPELPVYVLDAGLLVADVRVAEVDAGPLFPGFGGEFDRPEVGEAGVVVREYEREHLGEGVRPDRGLEVVKEVSYGLPVPLGEPLSDSVVQFRDHQDEDRRLGGDHGPEEVHLRPVKPRVRPPHRDVVEVFPPLLPDVGRAFVIVFFLGSFLVFDRLRQVGPLRRHLARGDPGIQRALRRDPRHGLGSRDGVDALPFCNAFFDGFVDGRELLLGRVDPGPGLDEPAIGLRLRVVGDVAPPRAMAFRLLVSEGAVVADEGEPIVLRAIGAAGDHRPVPLDFLRDRSGVHPDDRGDLFEAPSLGEHVRDRFALP